MEKQNDSTENNMQFFEAFLQLHTLFRLFKNSLSEREDVANSRLIFSYRFGKEEGVNWFDIGVLAQMENGNDLDWYYEVWWNSSWIIKSSVNKREVLKDGSDTLHEFPNVECVTLDDACIQMLICAKELLTWKPRELEKE